MQIYIVVPIPRLASQVAGGNGLGESGNRQVEISHQDLIAGCPPILS